MQSVSVEIPQTRDASCFSLHVDLRGEQVLSLRFSSVILPLYKLLLVPQYIYIALLFVRMFLSPLENQNISRLLHPNVI